MSTLATHYDDVKQQELSKRKRKKRLWRSKYFRPKWAKLLWATFSFSFSFLSSIFALQHLLPIFLGLTECVRLLTLDEHRHSQTQTCSKNYIFLARTFATTNNCTKMHKDFFYFFIVLCFYSNVGRKRFPLAATLTVRGYSCTMEN